jgi:D-methionine transport system ATP-binding protein
MLKLEDVNLFYQKNNHVLKNISFETQKEEILGIIGLSGAGKSSLLKTFNLLQKPSSGKIFLDNIQITDLKKKELRQVRKQISVVFQNYNLLSSRTVFENVALALELEHEKSIELKVMNVLEKVGLSHRKDAYISQLSGGEKQRTAIARAVVTNPKILLLDEPTSALDPKTTEKILDLVLYVNKEFGITTIVVTHEMEVIKRICDRVLYLKDGTIKFLGQTHRLFVEKDSQILEDFYEEIRIDKELINQKLEKKESHLLRIVFWGSSTHCPVISTLSLKYSVTYNILYGKIEHLKNNPYGTLILELSENPNYSDFLNELKKNVYFCEELTGGGK